MQKNKRKQGAIWKRSRAAAIVSRFPLALVWNGVVEKAVHGKVCANREPSFGFVRGRASRPTLGNRANGRQTSAKGEPQDVVSFTYNKSLKCVTRCALHRTRPTGAASQPIAGCARRLAPR